MIGNGVRQLEMLRWRPVVFAGIVLSSDSSPCVLLDSPLLTPCNNVSNVSLVRLLQVTGKQQLNIWTNPYLIFWSLTLMLMVNAIVGFWILPQLQPLMCFNQLSSLAATESRKLTTTWFLLLSLGTKLSQWHTPAYTVILNQMIRHHPRFELWYCTFNWSGTIPVAELC